MLLLVRILLASSLLYIIVLLQDTEVYGNAILLSASGISPQGSFNFTLGNNTYVLVNNKNGNLEMLSISNVDKNKIFDKLTASDNNTGNQNWQKDIVVPFSVAIIGGIAASWNFFQARLRGRYLQKLILEELREFEPTDIEFEPIDLEGPLDKEESPIGRDKIYGTLQSHMNKQFIHKEILDNPTENKEFIFNTNHHLIYLTTQLWHAFESNNGAEFLKYFCYISQHYKVNIKIPQINIFIIQIHIHIQQHKIHLWKKYDKKGKIDIACRKWIKLLTKDNHETNSKDIKLPENYKFNSENIEDTFSRKGDCTPTYLR
jgi:hypothetical protein